jgi:hypothetical protein
MEGNKNESAQEHQDRVKKNEITNLADKDAASDVDHGHPVIVGPLAHLIRGASDPDAVPGFHPWRKDDESDSHAVACKKN